MKTGVANAKVWITHHQTTVRTSLGRDPEALHLVGRLGRRRAPAEVTNHA